MNRLAVSTLVLALATSGVALADPPHHGYESRRHAEQRWQGRGDYDRRDWRQGRDHRDYRGYRDQRWGSYGHAAPRYYYGPRGYYGHRWARGQWLPAEYRARYYYVPDYWRYGYRVYAPPVGCRWVRHDGDLILTALATGLVLDVIYDAYD